MWNVPDNIQPRPATPFAAAQQRMKQNPANNMRQPNQQFKPAAQPNPQARPAVSMPAQQQRPPTPVQSKPMQPTPVQQTPIGYGLPGNPPRPMKGM